MCTLAYIFNIRQKIDIKIIYRAKTYPLLIYRIMKQTLSNLSSIENTEELNELKKTFNDYQDTKKIVQSQMKQLEDLESRITDSENKILDKMSIMLYKMKEKYESNDYMTFIEDEFERMENILPGLPNHVYLDVIAKIWRLAAGRELNR